MINNTMNQQKNYFELTGEEHEAIAQEAVQKAVEKMHSQGVASVEVVDGKRYLHHPNGSLTPINSDNASQSN